MMLMDELNDADLLEDNSDGDDNCNDVDDLNTEDSHDDNDSNVRSDDDIRDGSSLWHTAGNDDHLMLFPMILMAVNFSHEFGSERNGKHLWYHIDFLVASLKRKVVFISESISQSVNQSMQCSVCLSVRLSARMHASVDAHVYPCLRVRMHVCICVCR